MPVPSAVAGGREPLPGEHGMRTFPGFYVNLPDTLGRIRFGANPNGVFDNLVSCSQLDFARAGGRADLILPLTWSTGWTVDQIRQTALSLLETGLRLPPEEAAYFVERLLVFFSSCDARRHGQWEGTSWSEFTASGQFSTEYQRLLAGWINRELLAAKSSDVSALTVAILWEQGLYNLMGRSGNGSFDRVLNLPTNQAWINPWVHQLTRLGVRFEHAEVKRLILRRRQIAGVLVQRGSRGRRVTADWYVLAVPAERAAPLLRGIAASADPALAGIGSLRTAWENGIQFFLRQQLPIIDGHVLYVDSPWAISSISQQQFWPSRSFPRDYGTGAVKDCLSVDIADWDTPGVLYNKPARACTPAEIAREVWTQLKDSLNDTGDLVLSDGMLESWFLDPGLALHRGQLTNQDPLMISTPGSWPLRPQASTAIANLFLAADYVQTSINTACMEGANEAARRAVNALLDAAGSRATPAAVLPLYAPPEFEGLRAQDAQRYASGQPNLFDTPPPPSLNLPSPLAGTGIG